MPDLLLYSFGVGFAVAGCAGLFGLLIKYSQNLFNLFGR